MKKKKSLTYEEVQELRKDPLVDAVFRHREAYISLLLHQYRQLVAGAGLNPLGFKLVVKVDPLEPWPVSK